MQLFNRYISTRTLTVFGGELLLIFGSVALAARLQGTPDLAANLWKIGLVTVICQLCLYYNDFYDLTLVHSSRELIVRLLQAVGAASIVLAALYFSLPWLMIVRAGVTPKPAIERALSGLEMSKVLGLVLNEAGANGSDTSTYEGYGYIAG